jgi:uncharacterized protein YqcC (DUF446 family)
MKAGFKSDRRSTELLELLAHLEQVMKTCRIWSESTPNAQALKSTQPFCVDTLSFENWLQFVMIPTFKRMVIDRVALPCQCEIESMADLSLKIEHKSDVMFVIRSIDQLLTVS